MAGERVSGGVLVGAPGGGGRRGGEGAGAPGGSGAGAAGGVEQVGVG